MCVRILLAAALILLAIPAFAQWKPVPGPLATKWSKDVTPETAHREYPRPQLVRKHWTNLNGLWDYALTKKGGRPEKYDGKILVPFPIESSLSGVMKRVPADERAQWRADLERELSTMPAGDREKLAQVVSDPCSKDNLKFELGGRSSPYEARLRLACTKIMADKATFGRALWDNVPKMMFIFLPLIAAVMSALYLGSRRYYVEHLVFFVHYHAFFFLAGILLLICEQLGNPEGNAIARAFDTIANLLEFVCLFYVPWYLYRAMRRVYGQGRLWTLAKFFVLNLAYIVCILLTGIGLLFYTALSL